MTYRAVLTYAPGRTVTSATRTVTVVQARVETATIHYNRPDGGYDAWGLHLFGDGLAPGEATAEWTNADAVRRRPTATARCTGSRSPTTPSASASSSTSRPPGDPNVKDTDQRPVLHPARHAGDLAAPGRRADLQLRRGQRDLRRAFGELGAVMSSTTSKMPL